MAHVAGRPTRELPARELLAVSVYWLGITAIWNGLYVIVFPKRVEAIFGPASAGLALLALTLAGAVIAIIVQPTIGAISDYTQTRWGRRKPFIFVGGLLDVVFLWALASAETYVAMVVALILLQLSSNFAQGPFQGYVPDLVPARQVGRASGLMGVMTIVGGLIGVGIVLVGYLQLQPGMSAQAVNAALFLPTVALGLVEVTAMLVVVFTVHEGRAGLDREGRSWLTVGLSAWGTDILGQRSYVAFLLSRLCFLAVPGVAAGYAVYLLERSFRLPPQTAAPYVIVIGAMAALAAAAATIPAARLSDRIGRKRVIFYAFGLAAIGIIGFAASPMLELTILSILPLGLAAGTFLAVDWALMTDIIPKARAGRYMGIANVATASAGPLGLAVAGVVLYVVTRAGMPSGATSDAESTLLGAGPRAAIASMVLLLAISALALRRVDETPRED